MKRTCFFMGDDAEHFKRTHCELCTKPAREWVVLDKFGSFESDVYTDRHGNVCGLLCPTCAKKD